jgi:hypothetical protein
VDVPCRRSLGLFQFDLEGPRGVRRIHQVLQFADTGIGRSVLPIHKSCNRHLVTAFLPYRWWLHCAQRRALLDVRDQCSSEHSNSQRAAVQRFFRLLCTRFGWIKAVFSHEQVAGLRLHCCLQQISSCTLTRTPTWRMPTSPSSCKPSPREFCRI